MQIIGSGFGRTGTLSMKAALELLGFGPCYHMEEVVRRASHIAAWEACSQGEAPDWLALFASFGSTVDFPASVVYLDILEAFPDAKVLHTVRKPDQWYESTLETIYTARTLVPAWMRSRIPLVRRALAMADNLIWDGLFEGRFADREFAIGVFEQWTADVIASVPADRLLVFDVSEGWEPLCAFLDVPVPSVSFPHVNDRQEMARRFTTIRIVTRVAPPLLAVMAIAAVARIARR
jgi:hypothetical protein